MQRTGRKGLANFRVVVQDSRFSPSSGRVVALLGHYNPHTKETVLDKEKAAEYLKNGAQPSPRVVKLLKEEKVSLPSWVDDEKSSKKREIKNPEKLRKNQPKEEVKEEPVAEESEATSEEQPAEEAPKEPEAEQTEEPKAEEPAETVEEPAAEEKPAEA